MRRCIRRPIQVLGRWPRSDFFQHRAGPRAFFQRLRGYIVAIAATISSVQAIALA
jgi:hypothetical protein